MEFLPSFTGCAGRFLRRPLLNQCQPSQGCVTVHFHTERLSRRLHLDLRLPLLLRHFDLLRAAYGSANGEPTYRFEWHHTQTQYVLAGRGAESELDALAQAAGVLV